MANVRQKRKKRVFFKEYEILVDDRVHGKTYVRMKSSHSRRTGCPSYLLGLMAREILLTPLYAQFFSLNMSRNTYWK